MGFFKFFAMNSLRLKLKIGLVKSENVEILDSACSDQKLLLKIGGWGGGKKHPLWADKVCYLFRS